MIAPFWIRGILSDEYGVPGTSATYFLGGEEEPGRPEKLPLKLPPEIQVRPIPLDRTLAKMIAGLKFLIAAPVAWIYRGPLEQRLGITHLPDKKTIVVLPFRIDGDTPSPHYAAGLTDVLTDRLGDMPQLRVLSLIEVLESRIMTPRQAFGLFGANLVVTGSIHRAQEAFQIVLSIADGKEGRQLRGRTLTTAGFNSLGAETQIIDAVVHLRLEVAPEQRIALRAHGTENPTAHE